MVKKVSRRPPRWRRILAKRFLWEAGFLLRRFPKSQTGWPSLLESFLGIAPADELLREIRTPGSSRLTAGGDFDAIFFSGGVADLIYHNCENDFRYGDIGVLLGRSVRQSRLCRDFQMPEAGETICATVVGAGMYTTTISGSTISYSSDIFPMKNVPVLKLGRQLEEDCFQGRKQSLIWQIRWFLDQTGASRLVMAMRGGGGGGGGKRNPDYGEIMPGGRCLWKLWMRRFLMGLLSCWCWSRISPRRWGRCCGGFPAADASSSWWTISGQKKEIIWILGNR